MRPHLLTGWRSGILPGYHGQEKEGAMMVRRSIATLAIVSLMAVLRLMQMIQRRASFYVSYKEFCYETTSYYIYCLKWDEIPKHGVVCQHNFITLMSGYRRGVECQRNFITLVRMSL